MEKENPKEKEINDETKQNTEENKGSPSKVKKKRKKPDITIPIFQINLIYNQMKFEKKNKGKKKEKQINLLNIFPMNKIQIFYPNNMANINIMNSNIYPQNKNNNINTNKDKSFFYTDDENDLNKTKNEKAFNKNYMPNNILFDPDFLSTTIDDPKIGEDSTCKSGLSSNIPLSPITPNINLMNNLNQNNNFNNPNMFNPPFLGPLQMMNMNNFNRNNLCVPNGLNNFGNNYFNQMMGNNNMNNLQNLQYLYSQMNNMNLSGNNFPMNNFQNLNQFSNLNMNILSNPYLANNLNQLNLSMNKISNFNNMNSFNSINNLLYINNLNNMKKSNNNNENNF